MIFVILFKLNCLPVHYKSSRNKTLNSCLIHYSIRCLTCTFVLSTSATVTVITGTFVAALAGFFAAATKVN